MKVGDQKKAIVLGAVAVVVVGVAVFRIMPRGVAPAVPSTQSDPSVDSGAEHSGTQSDGLITTPFSHPMLAQRENPESGGDGGGSSASSSSGSGLGGGYLPSGPLVFLPEGEPESGQESEQVPRASMAIRLQAVVHAGRPVAILEVDDKTVRAGEGAQLMHGWKVAKVSAECVILKGADGERTLLVGETLTVSVAPSKER